MDIELNTGDLLLSRKKSKVPITAINILTLILFLFVVFYLFFGLTTVDGRSMEDTILDKQQVFLLKSGYKIERGDIVTVNVGTRKNPHELIKRVIAISGDKLVYVRNSTNTYVNIYLCKSGDTRFMMLDEPYIKSAMLLSSFNPKSITVTEYFDRESIENIDISMQYDGGAEQIKQKLLDAAISIPKNKFYFLGDNRNLSNDSRNPNYGARSFSSINGKLLTVLYDGSFASKLLNFLF